MYVLTLSECNVLHLNIAWFYS